MLFRPRNTLSQRPNCLVQERKQLFKDLVKGGMETQTSSVADKYLRDAVDDMIWERNTVSFPDGKHLQAVLFVIQTCQVSVLVEKQAFRNLMYKYMNVCVCVCVCV